MAECRDRLRASARVSDQGAHQFGLLYLKLSLIAGGLLILRATFRRVRESPAISGTTKLLAAVSLVVWAAAIASGRLLAYTCTRLTVDTPCE